MRPTSFLVSDRVLLTTFVYIYSCAYEAVEKELPLNAPALLYYEDKELRNEQDSMMLGRDILIGFVFDEDKTETEVYLPEKDNWYLGDKLFQEKYIEMKSNVLSPTTIRAYKSMAKFTFQAIMDMPIEKITSTN